MVTLVPYSLLTKWELLNTAGNVVSIELREVKGVYFVREFGDSESLTRKTFTSRPRMEGLWVRLETRSPHPTHVPAGSKSRWEPFAQPG